MIACPYESLLVWRGLGWRDRWSINGDCCTYYLSDLLHISLIISIFVLYLKAF